MKTITLIGWVLWAYSNGGEVEVIQKPTTFVVCQANQRTMTDTHRERLQREGKPPLTEEIWADQTNIYLRFVCLPANVKLVEAN
jgi:hypothetical protein